MEDKQPINGFPTTETPIIETPTEETLITQAPVFETPIAQAPVVQTPVQEELVKERKISGLIVASFALTILLAFIEGVFPWIFSSFASSPYSITIGIVDPVLVAVSLGIVISNILNTVVVFNKKIETLSLAETVLFYSSIVANILLAVLLKISLYAVIFGGGAILTGLLVAISIWAFVIRHKHTATYKKPHFIIPIAGLIVCLVFSGLLLANYFKGIVRTITEDIRLNVVGENNGVSKELAAGVKILCNEKDFETVFIGEDGDNYGVFKCKRDDEDGEWYYLVQYFGESKYSDGVRDLGFRRYGTMSNAMVEKYFPGNMYLYNGKDSINVALEAKSASDVVNKYSDAIYSLAKEYYSNINSEYYDGLSFVLFFNKSFASIKTEKDKLFLMTRIMAGPENDLLMGYYGSDYYRMLDCPTIQFFIESGQDWEYSSCVRMTDVLELSSDAKQTLKNGVMIFTVTEDELNNKTKFNQMLKKAAGDLR